MDPKKNLAPTPAEQKTQTRSDRQAEEHQDAKKAGGQRARDQRLSAAAATLPAMPGPKPGGLAEMATPEALAASLERSRGRRAEYEDAKVRAGIKDARRPGNTPANMANFAEGASIKPHDRVTVNRNPRFDNPPQPMKSVTDAFPKQPAKDKK